MAELIIKNVINPRQLDYQNLTDVVVARKLVNLKESSAARGIEFNLSFSKLKRLLTTKTCFYTGVEITKDNRSIDRKDNTQGYIDSNVVICDSEFNNKKANLTLEDIESLYKKLIKKPVKRKSSSSKQKK